MNCNDSYILANLLIDNDLNEADQVELEAHLIDCKECSRLFEELKELNSCLTPEEEEIPVDLTEDIMTRLNVKQAIEYYQENKKLKVLLILESIAVLTVIFLSLPDLTSNLQIVTNSITYFINNLEEINSTAINILTSHISLINQVGGHNVAIIDYAIIIILCIAINYLIINSLRRQNI